MMKKFHVVCSIPLVSILFWAAGCSSLDRANRKMDMASEHVGTDKPVYEGRLTSAQAVGALVSLQFSDGQLFEVAKDATTFIPGDIVRVYKTESGYEAHLWKAAKDVSPSSVIPPVPPAKH